MKSTLASFRLVALLRTGVAPTALLAVGMGSGCTDEAAPATWVKRLDEVAKRSDSVQRLSQMFEDRMSKSGSDRSKPEVTEFSKLVTPALVTVAGTPGLDEKTRMATIKLLSDMRDAAAFPAFAKVLAAGSLATPEEIRDASSAIAALAKSGVAVPANVADELWARFASSKPSTLKSIQAVRALTDAVVSVKAPSYAPKAAAMLRLPVGATPTDRTDALEYAQSTAAHVLGALKAPDGARALVACLLDPAKGGAAPTFIAALRKTPGASELALLGALNGSDAEYLALTSALQDGKWRAMIAEALSSISRPAGRDAVIAVLDRTTDPADRAALTLTLVNFPVSKGSVDAFIASFKKIPADSLMGAANARALLATVSASLMDPALVSFLSKEIADAKGDFADEFKKSALVAVSKLMGPEDVAAVGALVAKHAAADSSEKKFYDTCASALATAKKDPAANIALLLQTAGTTTAGTMSPALKAAWNAGMYGNDNTRADLVQAYTSGKALTLPTLTAIDHLAPSGDDISATALEGAVGKRPGVAALDDAAAKLADKLRARKSK